MSDESEIIGTYVEKIKASDEEAFKNLFEKLWEPLYGYAYSLLEDKASAKDMVQDVWIDFWERRHTIENNNIRGYLHKAVRFRVFKELRDSRLKKSHLEALHLLYEDETADQETLSPEETRKIIENKLSVLPARCKEVFKLSRLGGLKNREIAEKLGISESTVEGHITTAFKRLKKMTALLFSTTLVALLLYFFG
ncbi:RNA polymerase sigma-70 factor [Sinomicrobium kalidii]|uniref:RNA polymerase sigma-70 factor n=1 Tax=Sinomicrobium kalidii TaxID=2900738 RepID=UPI001E4663A2|nr:RNA polymerase sigma-70 factor [Sinomicrobium kalidii]UGU17898.1 RNA polymerase sigma-70 factor [Sinomicrobium kalidii]